MNLKTFAAKLLGVATPATQRAPTISPRAEPANLGSTAKASDIQSAIRSAELGDPERLFRLYRDSLLSDDHVQGCLNTRKLAVLGQPLAIMPRNRLNPDDVAAAAACNRAVEDCENWKNGLGSLLDSALWPVAVAEKLFKPAEALDYEGPRLQWTLKRLEAVNPMLFCWKWAYQSGAAIDLEAWEPLLKLWPVDAAGNITRDITKATPLDPVRHLAHRGHLLTGFKDNWGGPMRAILGWWLLRALGRDWFGRFMERYGMPFPKGKTNAQDPQAVAFLQEAFSLATKVGGIVIGQDDEVELVQATVQGGAEGHKLWHEVCNNAISKHVTGIEASANPAGLNAGASNKAENVREDVRMFDQMILCETLEKQLFAQFLRINGLTGRIKLSFGGLSDDDAGAFATTLNTLGQAGFEPTDEAIPTINERLGIPVRRKAAAAPFGFPPPGGPRPANPAPPTEPDDEDEPAAEVETFAVRDLKGRILTFSAGADTQPARATRPDPVDALAAAHAREVGAAMAEGFAPVVAILQGSTSATDAEAKLAAYFSDWRPKQFVAALEKPLQLAAAKGAIEGKA